MHPEEPMPLQVWRRRWWRPDPQALAAYAGLRPMVVVTTRASSASSDSTLG